MRDEVKGKKKNNKERVKKINSNKKKRE